MTRVWQRKSQNFVEFLQFRVWGKDVHLENSAKNFTYLSKELYNTFIKHAGKGISLRITEEVKKSGLHIKIADET